MYALEVTGTLICPTPPASVLRLAPKKFATPPPNIVSVRPVTF